MGAGIAESVDDFGAEAIEEFFVAEVDIELAFVGVDEDEVDIGTEVELSAAELSQGDDGEVAFRATPAVPVLGVPMGEDVGEGEFGEIAQFGSCFGEGGALGDFAKGDAEGLAAFEAAKSGEVIVVFLVIRERGEVCLHLGQASVRSATGIRCEPDEGLRVVDDVFDGSGGEGEEVENGVFSEGERLDGVGEGGRVRGPGVGETFEGVGGLRGIEREIAFLFDPSGGRRRAHISGEWTCVRGKGRAVWWHELVASIIFAHLCGGGSGVSCIAGFCPWFGQR